MPSDQPLDGGYVAANRAVVDRVLTRVAESGLVAEAADTDPDVCRTEAEKLRDLLNMELPNIRDGGVVDAAFKRMRRSARDFVRAAGPGAATFRTDPAHFTACLAAMRLTLGEQSANLTREFAR